MQRGISPFTADKNHLHHFLYKVKVDVMFTVKLLLAIQIAFAVIGFQLAQSDNLLTLILFGVFFFIFLNLFDQRLRKRKKVKKPVEPISVSHPSATLNRS